MESCTSSMMILRRYDGHIEGWQCRVLVEATTLRGLVNCAQIWGMNGPYNTVKYVSVMMEDTFLREE